MGDAGSPVVSAFFAFSVTTMPGIENRRLPPPEVARPRSISRSEPGAAVIKPGG